jgi:hypothetical protein
MGLKRELQLMVLVGAYLSKIVKTYPNTRSLVEELQSKIIALTIDWE